MSCIHFLDSRYPLGLRDLEAPPSTLYIRGDTDLETRPVLAVVGSRDCSPMAEVWMRRHLCDVSRFCLIVSGGARGVDECAHRAALMAEQPTAVVLPSGLDNPYPSMWSALQDEVLAAGGCFLSEYEASRPMRRGHFEKRNRLIAALSDVVLVVEGQLKSGTALTVRHAQELGRAVAVVPWFPGDPRGELGLELMTQSAAHPVRGSVDLMGLLARESQARMTRWMRSAVPDFSNQPESRP